MHKSKSPHRLPLKIINTTIITVLLCYGVPVDVCPAQSDGVSILRPRAVGQRRRPQAADVPIKIYAKEDANIKLAIVQCNFDGAIGISPSDAPEYNLLYRANPNYAYIKKMLSRILNELPVSHKPDIILFPEGLCEGHALIDNDDLIDSAGKQSLDGIRKIATLHGIVIGYGGLRNGDKGRMAGCYFLVRPNGEVRAYEKKNCLLEDRIFGIKKGGININIAVAICDEMEDPTVPPYLSKSGAELLLIPAHAKITAPAAYVKDMTDRGNFKLAIVINGLEGPYYSEGVWNYGNSTWVFQNPKEASGTMATDEGQQIAVIGYNANGDVANVEENKANALSPRRPASAIASAV